MKSSGNLLETFYPVNNEATSSKQTRVPVSVLSSKQSYDQLNSSKQMLINNSSSHITSSSSSSSSKKTTSDIYKSSLTLHTRDSLVMPATQNAFTKILDRLKTKDISFTEISFCNSKIVSQTKNSFQLLSEHLSNNLNIVMIQFINVSMRDLECEILTKALITCISLEVLNIESNQLSVKGLVTLLGMVEKHPSIRELRIANQSMGYCLESDRALANCLSQNTNITKFTHEFMETSIQLLCETYIKRNMDMQRKIRASARSGVAFVMPALDPYPFPVGDLSEKTHNLYLSETAATSTSMHSLKVTVCEETKPIKTSKLVDIVVPLSKNTVPTKPKSTDILPNSRINEKNNESVSIANANVPVKTESTTTSLSVDEIPPPTNSIDCIDTVSSQFKSKYEMNMTKEDALRKEPNTSNTDAEHVRRQSVHFSKMGATFVNKTSLSSKSFRRLTIEVPSNTSISSKG